MARSNHGRLALAAAGVLLFLHGSLWLPTRAAAQTLPAGVYDAPPLTIEADQSIGSHTTVNVFEGGTVGRGFTAGSPGVTATDTVVNLAGGTLGDRLSAYTGYGGSELNVTGGSVQGSTVLREGARARVSGGELTSSFVVGSDSVADISGGKVGVRGFGLSVASGGVANISGGQFTGKVSASSGGELNITGGSFPADFVARPGSLVRFSGGEFLLNGSPIGDAPVTINDRLMPDLVTGTLEDGSVVLFSPALYGFSTGVDELNGVTFQNTSVPPVDLAPIAVDDSSTIQGLRQGQTLTVNPGGSLPDHFVAVGATLNLAGGSVGNGMEVANATVNVTGGALGSSNSATGQGEEFRAFGNSVLNLSGGRVDNWLYAYRGATVNLAGPVTMEAPVFFEPGSTANISAGEFASYLVASGAEVNISGGVVRQSSFTANDGSQVTMSGGHLRGSTQIKSGSHFLLAGGVVGEGFRNAPGRSPSFREGDFTIAGGEFRLNGAPIADATVSLLEVDDVLTGTLPDGSPFVFSYLSNDILYDIELVSAPLPAIDPTPLIIDSAVAPAGLRDGQSLTLLPGGELPSDFAAIGASLKIRGGAVGGGLEVVNSQVDVSSGNVGFGLSIFDGSVVNVTGGNLGGFIDLNSGGTLNVSGGHFERLLYVRNNAVLNLDGGMLGDQLTVTEGGVVNMTGGEIGARSYLHEGGVMNLSGGRLGSSFNALDGGQLNLIGSEFYLDGTLLALPASGDPIEFLGRSGTLSGTLADGTSFEWFLNGQGLVELSIATDALVTIAFGVPEPTTAALLGVALGGLLVAGRYSRDL